MDIVSPEKMDIVCKGCLCQDENLTSEQSDLVKKLYHDIMNLPIAVETFDTLKLRLCVECTTNILNYDAFKKQCHIAHEILNKHFAMEANRERRTPGRLERERLMVFSDSWRLRLSASCGSRHAN